jgi:hypothetical protein
MGERARGRGSFSAYDQPYKAILWIILADSRIIWGNNKTLSPDTRKRGCTFSLPRLTGGNENESIIMDKEIKFQENFRNQEGTKAILSETQESFQYI